MSHVTSLDCVVTDLDALDRACKKRGLELVRGKTKYRWYGTWVNDYNSADAAYKNGIPTSEYGTSEHAITIPGDNRCYEIGLHKNKSGPGWRLALDFWAGGHGMVEKAGGKFAEGLLHDYQVEAAKSATQDLIDQGFISHEIVDQATGDTLIVLEDRGYTDAEVAQELALFEQ